MLLIAWAFSLGGLVGVFATLVLAARGPIEEVASLLKLLLAKKMQRERPLPPMHVREYEWRRLDTGARMYKPELAANACLFYLAAHRQSQVAKTTEQNAHLPDVAIFVTATGERVRISGEPGGSAKLKDWPDAPTFREMKLS